MIRAGCALVVLSRAEYAAVESFTAIGTAEEMPTLHRVEAVAT
jgi:hypothetical protein